MRIMQHRFTPEFECALVDGARLLKMPKWKSGQKACEGLHLLEEFTDGEGETSSL